MADAWRPLPVHKRAVQLHNGGSWPKFGLCHFLHKISEFSFILFQQAGFATAIRFLNWEKREEDICTRNSHFFINFPFTPINIWDSLSGWLKFPFWCLHFCSSWKRSFQENRKMYWPSIPSATLRLELIFQRCSLYWWPLHIFFENSHSLVERWW